MTRIVTTAYRYKPPQRRKKAAPLAGPAVVTSHAGKAKAEPAVTAPPPANDDRKPAHAAASGAKPAVVTTARRKPSKLHEQVSVSASPAQEARSAAAPSAIVATVSRKHRITDGPTLPMELPLSRKPIERDGADYKRLKAAMTRRLRGETN
jgi:hypothetical protein